MDIHPPSPTTEPIVKSSLGGQKRSRVCKTKSIPDLEEMHYFAKLQSKDPDGYVKVTDSKLVRQLVASIGDTLAVLQGIDLFRQLYCGPHVKEYSHTTKDEMGKDGKKTRPLMPVDHPFFRMTACISVASKFVSQDIPPVFKTYRREMRFSNDHGVEFGAEMDVLKKAGFAPFKAVCDEYRS